MKAVPFEKVQKHLVKFVAKKDYRPVLTCVNVEKHFVIATNAHVLVRVSRNEIEDIPNPGVYVAKTMEKVELNYPETERLLPQDFNNTFEFDIKWMLKTLREVKKVMDKDKNKPIGIVSEGETLELIYRKDGMKQSIALPYKVTDDDSIRIAVNIDYMINTLLLLKLFTNTAQFRYVSSLRPCIIQNEVVKALLLPIRFVGNNGFYQ